MAATLTARADRRRAETISPVQGSAVNRGVGRHSAGASPWKLLFGPWSVGVGLVVMAGAVVGALVIDPGASGVDVCWVRRFSGLPCPGCGLTRSVIALAQGELRRSLAFHPFGPVVLLWAAAAVSSLLLGERLRRRVAAFLESSRRGFHKSYRVLIAAFVGFGVLRLLGSALGIWQPEWWGGAFGP